MRVDNASRELQLLLVEACDDLVDEATRVRNRNHADLLMLMPGYQQHAARLVGVGQRAWVRSAFARRRKPQVWTARERLARLLALGGQIRALEDEIGERVAGHPLLSLPGVGRCLAVKLLGEVGDAARFRSADGLRRSLGRYLSIVKTADAASVDAGQNIGFTITVTNNGVADATGVTISDPLPGGTGIDWAESPDNPNCTIDGSPPLETLNCGPVTLAAGGGSLSVHVVSATSGASCGIYDNTATFTSTNAGDGSDDATVTVNCAAIKILKQSTKTDADGNPVLVANEGAVFSITGPGGYTNDVTDDNAADVEDEDTTIGEVCISGLAPGAYTVNETTPPTGYGGATQTDVIATAAVGTNCTDAQPTSGVAVFSNPPLAEIEVIVRDLGSGETHSSIVCALGATTIDAVDENLEDDPAFDDTDEVFTNLDPGTYICTVVVDP